MLKISTILSESYDESTKMFVSETLELTFEHSLAALSKWESKWEEPFLTKEEKTTEQIFSYMECMCLTPDVAPEVFLKLDEQNRLAINDYINAKMTATTFKRDNKPSTGEVITSELIYYWMTAHQIPWEAQYWHINRLFALIRVCNLKNQPEGKPQALTRDDLATRRAENERRRAQLGTSG